MAIKIAKHHIKRMTIHGLRECDGDTMCVKLEDIVQYRQGFSTVITLDSIMSEHAFFMLACDYLESLGFNTELARKGVWS